jgi:hypothetical protein
LEQPIKLIQGLVKHVGQLVPIRCGPRIWVCPPTLISRDQTFEWPRKTDVVTPDGQDERVNTFATHRTLELLELAHVADPAVYRVAIAI